MTQLVQPEANNLAIASLVLGILSLVGMGPLTGIPAIITGFMALKNPSGKGMAIAGLIMGGLSILLLLLILLFIIVLVAIGAFAASTYDHAPMMDQQDLPDSSMYQQRA